MDNLTEKTSFRYGKKEVKKINKAKRELKKLKLSHGISDAIRYLINKK